MLLPRTQYSWPFFRVDEKKKDYFWEKENKTRQSWWCLFSKEANSLQNWWKNIYIIVIIMKIVLFWIFFHMSTPKYFYLSVSFSTWIFIIFIWSQDIIVSLKNLKYAFISLYTSYRRNPLFVVDFSKHSNRVSCQPCRAIIQLYKPALYGGKLFWTSGLRDERCFSR